MKALSIKQPYASLIAIGKKTIETRTWATNYRGKLLIVSSKKPVEKGIQYSGLFNMGLRFGMAIAVVNLIDCRHMKSGDTKKARCPYCPELYSWVLSSVKKIEPFPVKGQLRLFEVDYRDA
ncbi:MAG: ASCH domain-containing protein [Desulfobacteraceae bacterium]|nr:ASCH domain-containing protein [Desulfobacteraceae bacterium]